MRSDGRRGIRIHARRRSGVLNSKLGGGGASKEIVIVARVEPHFVGAALASHNLDGVTIAVIDDQRIRAAAAEANLVIRADRHTLWSEAACVRLTDWKDCLDLEWCALGDPHNNAVASPCRPGHRNVEIELAVARIERTLLDAAAGYDSSGVRVAAAEADAFNAEVVFPNEGDEG